MKLPWISRSSHEEITSLLSARIRDMEARERLYIDRLAVGGPIFATVAGTDASPGDAEEQPELTRRERFMREIARLSHRPSKMAAAITRGLAREERQKAFGPN